MEITYQNFYKQTLRFVKLTGWTMMEQGSKISIHTVFYWINLINLYFINLTIIEIAIFGGTYNDEDLFFGIICGILATTLLMKIVIFGWKRKEICEIIEYFEIFYPKKKDSTTMKLFKNYYNFRMFCTVLSIITCGVNELLAMISLIFFGNRLLFFPIPAFDPSANLFIYLIVNLWQWLTFAEIGLTTFGLDLLLFTMITTIALEFKCLKKEFENVKSVRKEDEIKKKLIELYKKQLKMKEISGKLNSIFSFYFLFYFIMLGVVIAIMTFEISISSFGSSIFTINLIFWSAQVTQLFFLCFFAQTLLTNSIEVTDGIYDCGWENFEDLKLKKMVLFMLTNSQDKVKLTMSSFGTISLSLFSDVRLILS